jgi:hypothetical protein
VKQQLQVCDVGDFARGQQVFGEFLTIIQGSPGGQRMIGGVPGESGFELTVERTRQRGPCLGDRPGALVDQRLSGQSHARRVKAGRRRSRGRQGVNQPGLLIGERLSGRV